MDECSEREGINNEQTCQVRASHPSPPPRHRSQPVEDTNTTAGSASSRYGPRPSQVEASSGERLFFSLAELCRHLCPPPRLDGEGRSSSAAPLHCWCSHGVERRAECEAARPKGGAAFAGALSPPSPGCGLSQMEILLAHEGSEAEQAGVGCAQASHERFHLEVSVLPLLGDDNVQGTREETDPCQDGGESVSSRFLQAVEAVC
mmetsp:Transcript_36151/g.94036  ORF Transcript_36151/g.94036 Transcript_36151/m.94036 type:complete len:204 (-) Transcript_36151:848-1459(-)